MMTALQKHYQWRGKIEINTRAPLDTAADLALAYTPGVAEACLEIQKDASQSFELTRRWNTVAVITDGTAVLGLGDIGPLAAMPVMEGKCALFKKFGDVDAIPICVASKDVDDIVNTIKLIAGSFGGINLEDIAAPRCFEIEARLKAALDIPIFHDDQHGTAIVVLAAVINTLRLTGKSKEDVKIILNGAGAAGNAICMLLLSAGLKNVIACDRDGILYQNKPNMSIAHMRLAECTNPHNITGNLPDAMIGADIFIGVSAPNVVTQDMVRSMNDHAAVFAMANPVPEIMPDLAKKAGAYIVATGRSDFPNQINNVMAFPGIFRGALDIKAKEITEVMKIRAAEAIANAVTDRELSPDYMMPSALNKAVSQAVARAVSGQ